jgi:hypothetical protein
VRKASQFFPSTNGFEDGHVLVVRVVTCAECREDVAEGLFSLKVLFVLGLESLECGRVVD